MKEELQCAKILELVENASNKGHFITKFANKPPVVNNAVILAVLPPLKEEAKSLYFLVISCCAGDFSENIGAASIMLVE